jgi:hypothetical protein
MSVLTEFEIEQEIERKEEISAVFLDDMYKNGRSRIDGVEYDKHDVIRHIINSDDGNLTKLLDEMWKAKETNIEINNLVSNGIIGVLESFINK